MKKSKLICKIVILPYSTLDYMFDRFKIENDLKKICDVLKRRGVRLFEYEDDLIRKDFNELILNIFDAIKCDLDPDVYLYIYSSEADFKLIDTSNQIFKKYMIKEKEKKHT